jgi:crotonobetainyl-CoA:carnitine CoA-transferase CaiB-like acyl-CoA transferase
MPNDLPLKDVKICDFMWVMAGPASTRILADYGATVVRIESPTRVDTARTLQPYYGNQFGPDSSGLFANCNAGKFGISLDLGNPAARGVVHDLVRWADVVTESFSPKAMRAWGFDYETLRRINPGLIMLSSCLMGQTGPLAKIAGFGNMAAAISGFTNLTGWPDRPPSGVFGAYTDYVAPRFTAMAILAALDYRRRTGDGQYIDQSQAECAIHFLGPAILNYTVNGRVEQRVGNSDTAFAPHGVYPAAGDDNWVAIVCRDDDDWRRLCAAMENEDLARNSIAARSNRAFSRTGFPPTRCRTAPTRMLIRSSSIAATSLRSIIPVSANSRSRVLAQNCRALRPLSAAWLRVWGRTINTSSKPSSATAKLKSLNWWLLVPSVSGANPAPVARRT